MLKRFWRGIAACIVAMLLLLPFAGPAAADSAGAVHYFLMAGSPQDRYTSDPSMHSWFTTHIWRMGVFSSYFDEKTSWYPNGWVYDDSYAIYRGSASASQHPEWILKDSSGNPLYIPSGCSGGSCPQYAGDISNPAYRQAWIENLEAEIAHGYRGVFIDDVNMNMMVANGSGTIVVPTDRSTGRPMTPEAWRGYMAQFMQEVRAALPSAEIAHNVIWFADEHAGTANPSIRAEIESANYINLERGANDGGLTGGNGSWSLNALLSYVDEVHALRRGIVLNGIASDPQGLAYNLASYFLVSTGNDAVSGGAQTPENWWSGWSLELGEATSPRYAWNGLLRRDFTGGTALVNEANEPTQTIKLPSPMLDTNGNTVTSVTLPAASGTILRNLSGQSTPPPHEKPTEEAPTKTTVEATAPVTTSPVSSPPLVESTSGSGNGSQPAPKAASPPGTTTSKLTPTRTQTRHAKHRQRAGQSRRWHGRAARKRRVMTRIAGRVLRATRGKVTIQIELRQGRRWVPVAHLPAVVSRAGGFLHVLKLRAGARYRVRAAYAGTAGFRSSRSGYVLVVPHAARAAHTGAG